MTIYISNIPTITHLSNKNTKSYQVDCGFHNIVLLDF